MLARRTRHARRSRIALGALAAASLALVAACSSDDPCDGPTCPDSQRRGRLYVVNAARELGAMQVWVDGQLVWNRVDPASASGVIWLRPGEHTVLLVRPAAPTADNAFDVVVREEAPRLVVGVDQGGEFVPLVLPDTGTAVGEGKTKLRVVHAASGAPPVDVWKRQAIDALLGTRVMAPFPFGAASRYIEGGTSFWTITVTPRDDAASSPLGTPLATETVDLAAGRRATVVLVPGASAGTVDLVTIRER